MKNDDTILAVVLLVVVVIIVRMKRGDFDLEGGPVGSLLAS